MNMPRRFAVGLALVVVAPGCGNQTGPAKQPTPGTATVALVTPNADDGAVLLTLTGPGLANAQAANSAYLVYSRAVSPDELRVIVVGDLGATVLITVHVDDLNRVSEYAGTVVDAASRSDQSRSSLAGYGVTIAATQ